MVEQKLIALWHFQKQRNQFFWSTSSLKHFFLQINFQLELQFENETVYENWVHIQVLDKVIVFSSTI